MGSGGNNNPPPPPSPVGAIQQVNTPTVFEQIAADRLKKYNDWETAPGPHDIMDAPGIGDMVDIYGTADAAATKKRLGGDPQRALSAGGSSDYADQLDAQTAQNRYDDRAEGLSHGLASLKSEAYGLGGDAASLETQRKQAYAADQLNQYNSYYNRPKQPSLWEKIAGIAVGGLGAASGYFNHNN